MGHLIIPGSGNHGVTLCQPEHDVPEQSTIFIEGVARGGTSMIGALVSSAGYEMEAAPPSYECLEWKHAIKYGGDFESIISGRNIKYDRWAVKHPGLLDSWRCRWELFLGTLRNPRVIIVLRDAVAISMRSWLADRSHTIEIALRQQSALVNWAIGTSFPVMLVSYEKMIQATDETRRLFDGFVGGQCDWSLVEPNNAEYIRKIGTRHTA